MRNIFGMAGEFATRILQLPKPEVLQRLSPQRRKALVEHLDEERKELLAHPDLPVENEYQYIVDEADALIDTIYICARGLFEMGFTPEQAQFAFEEVHRANMDKVPGSNPKRPASEGCDAVKPAGWRGPRWPKIFAFRVDEQEQEDNVAVDVLAAAMKRKLAKAREDGKKGWQDCSPEYLSSCLYEHVSKGDPRDVANFCAFLWALGSPIVSPLSTQKVSVNLNQQAIAQTAEQLVMSREELYGSFKERATVVDMMTDAVEEHPNWRHRLKANHRHALRMIIEKIGRIVVGGDPAYPDNWKDIQGYAKLAEKDQ